MFVCLKWEDMKFEAKNILDLWWRIPNCAKRKWLSLWSFFPFRIGSGKQVASVIVDDGKDQEDEDDTFVVEDTHAIQNDVEVVSWLSFNSCAAKTGNAQSRKSSAVRR